MKPELTLLVWAVVLTFAQVLVAAIGAQSQIALPRLAGNRENLPALAGWAGRASRAHRNMLENLPLFTALVLISVIAGRTNAQTLLGAQIFVWSRLLFAVIYVVGVSWLRTAVYIVSVIGMALILFALV